MTIDPTRAAFVRQEFRFSEASDASVKSKHPSAIELTIATNLGESAAQTLATALLADLKGFAQMYELEIDGLLDLSTLTDGVPTFTITSSVYPVDSRTFKVSKVALDIAADKTIIEVVG